MNGQLSKSVAVILLAYFVSPSLEMTDGSAFEIPETVRCLRRLIDFNKN
jgi:hypothetical protein